MAHISPSDPLVPILRRTPLYPLHGALGAKLVPFSGWEMPVQYSGIGKEHQAVRQQAGMFDISHMGKFVLSGNTLIEQLQRLVPSDLSQLQPGDAQYTVLLNHQGGIVDDLILYYQGINAAGEPQITTIVNAATTEKDRNWFLTHLDAGQLTLTDLSVDRVLLAVQGPAAVAALQTCVQEDLSKVKRFGHIQGTVLEQPGFLARTGYTGEDGFEVMVDVETGIALWRSLLLAGVVPCGLGARDTLRLEAAMALYGQDIDETTTPLEAGMGWLVHLDRKGEFIGRSVLEQQKQAGVTRRLVGLQLAGRNIARHHYPVRHCGELVGTITSGTLSPTLGYPIALAYVPAALSKLNQLVDVEIRGKVYPATVVKRPFYKRVERIFEKQTSLNDEASLG
ncbi:glycine cleavage system aminomethyltransferase GcvT [Thermocoleostomius sinensis]|uniref:Aminomethyltransferase n=1 Tax=Thermocoleostomius sinensis A174 TaxID=2016057 RepID=A0A9E9CBP2_9CYAN|nr:glycine cleavage system aminomethyltransferase GcvT [Thermocoleostomius sinensis]WAL62717.1 glycine cleavage system aminomethyltransferase GcvT [Thermocoleostomius sinensis A174]